MSSSTTERGLHARSDLVPEGTVGGMRFEWTA